MTETQNSTIGRWKTGFKRDTLFLDRNCRGYKLPVRANKQTTQIWRKSNPASANKCFHPYLRYSLDHKLVQKVRLILFFVCTQWIVALKTLWLFWYFKGYRLTNSELACSRLQDSGDESFRIGALYVVLGNFSC